MIINFKIAQLPIKENADGVLLVGNTRVTLETLVAVFNRGATAEEIVVQYPALTLSDVYLTIGYYLQHQDEVDQYISEQRTQAEQVRSEVMAQSDLAGVRERLLARHEHMQRDVD